ncbi:MAG TPA: hypothetical protein VK864_02465, partial [Longimicrobiales bacterium]|nr:hypothetical protein [Longimicrobiales bacterium]
MREYLSHAFARVRRWYIDQVTERSERHGIVLTLYIEAAPLDKRELWPRLHAALDLIAAHSPVWLSRMR